MPTVSFNIHLPDYEILSELGRGNTRVLKARHLPTGDIVAIKQYAFAADADTLRRFERESQIMTQLDHPNVTRVREVKLEAAMPYVVMDFVEGGDLRSLLRQQGQLDLLTTLRLGLQMTGAFRAMHALNVIHRDVKPENILYRQLVSGELHFLLTDFGIAKFWADDSIKTLTGQSLMTYEYAAPEQFDNPRQVDEAADYYALGVVLYECLMGHVPFVLQNETGLAQFMQQVLSAPLPNIKLATGQLLPPSLATLLRGLLTRDPQTRLRNTNQMELLLEQSRVEYLANWSEQNPPVPITKTVAGPVVAPVVTERIDNEPQEELVEEAGRNSWQWWGVGGLVLAAGLAFGLYSYSTRPSANDLATPVDSTATMFMDSLQTEEQPAIDSSTVQEETTDDQMPTETAPLLPADSTANSGVTIPDSAGVMPPDSTQ
jgi:eukaryotic-like serine/threonine-protein kinase